ncbi:MAG TPA: class I SAM-dependent methyltransferase [Burkholderiales bacterium]|nr:class I SAM-dependent methyltransferase [Burkholderiales bacterium]
MTPFIRALALLVACAVPLAASFPVQAQKFEPQVGQAGKDVIWVPTPDEVVDRMLTMAQVGPNDFHMDLGSGDGKIVIAAAKRGAKALGIEYNPEMVKLAQDNAAKAGMSDKASFRRADIFQTDFSQATVITLYLLPALNMRLRPQLLAMKPGTRVVSHSFTMEDWEADEISTMDGRRAYFWVVPANVMGTWSLDAGGAKSELSLEQTFQKINGTVSLQNTVQGGLREARLRGPQIAFAYVDDKGMRREFTGTVNGRQMSGTLRDDKGQSGNWSATKK